LKIRMTDTCGVNSYYIQTLCLVYFPGESFGENDTSTLWCEVDSSSEKDGAVAVVRLGDREKSETFSGKGDCRRADLIPEDRDKCEKIAVGLAFEEAARAFTGYIPPWGILTGVRPARVVSALIDSGLSPEAAAEYLVKNYRADIKKARLAADVSVTESRVITPDQSGECSIYVAIPFCPTRCRYCSFVSVSSPGLLKLIPDYLPALYRDITNVANTVKELGLHVASVYVGGGTPTILEADQIAGLLNHIRSSVGADIPEFTYEAGRPDTITRDKLDAIVAGGVDRISVNTQTLNEEILRGIGRSHTAEQFFDAFRMAREAGVPQINVDFIAGLPGESADSFLSAVERVVELRPEDITVHTFTVKKAADYKWSDVYSRESVAAARSVDGAAEILSGAGYIPYYMYRQKNTVGNLENVGYSLPGHEGMYNIYMMEEVHTVFGAGASAVTRLTLTDPVTGEQHIERIFEPKYPYEYLKDHSGDTGEARREKLLRVAKTFYEKYR